MTRKTRKQKPTAKSLPPVKRRRFARSELAVWGYWSTPVQKVVRRWQHKIGEHWCQYYLPQCARSIFYPSTGISVTGGLIGLPAHSAYVLDLLLALNVLWNDKQKPARWLLELGNNGEGDLSDGPKPHSYARLRLLIGQRSGVYFDERALAQCAKRLHLSDRPTP